MEPDQLLELEPSLSPSVTGGYWFKDDKSVDARLVLEGLRKSCVDLGVELVKGDVTALSGTDKTCKLGNGQVYKGKDVVVASGAWIREVRF
jgi:glycine/D-amino acid oxidase-like deaminating enzyme